MVRHFDSGLVPNGAHFPRIDVLASIGDLFCYDQVVVVRGEPLAPNQLDLSVDRTGLYWSMSPASSDYDVVAGDLNQLRQSGGDFTGATGDCVAQDLDQPYVEFVTPLAPGQGLWFVVRGLPGAPYDSGAASQSGERGAEIEAAPASCP